MALSPEQRQMRGEIAANARWKKLDREARRSATSAATAANPGQIAYWKKVLDPEGTAEPTDLTKRATAARNEYLTRLRFASSKARARRRAEKAS